MLLSRNQRCKTVKLIAARKVPRKLKYESFNEDKSIHTNKSGYFLCTKNWSLNYETVCLQTKYFLNKL